MKTILLKGEKREGLGSATSKALRNEGKVPCVLYGGSDNLHFAVYEADFKSLIYTPNVYKVRIDVAGASHDAILQDMQFHPVSEAIVHADFMAVDGSKKVIMDIPVKVVGNAPGVRAGGKMVKKFNKLRVRGFIADLPDYIEVSIDTLEIGQSAKVKDLVAGNYEILDAKENAIVSIKTTRALMQAATEAAKGK